MRYLKKERFGKSSGTTFCAAVPEQVASEKVLIQAEPFFNFCFIFWKTDDVDRPEVSTRLDARSWSYMQDEKGN